MRANCVQIIRAQTPIRAKLKRQREEKKTASFFALSRPIVCCWHATTIGRRAKCVLSTTRHIPNRIQKKRRKNYDINSFVNFFPLAPQPRERAPNKSVAH